MINRYNEYLQTLKKGARKISRLEFLQPDDSVAFFLDGNSRRSVRGKYDSRAFLQDGSLNVSLQNGTRRSANIVLSNIDGAFDYNVNNIWFGRRVRLSKGIILDDGTEFYLPQGTFYLKNPTAALSHDTNTMSFELVDKWAYLDGSLLGTLENTYQVNIGTNIFNAIASILRLSKYSYASGNFPMEWMIDPVTPVFTSYYNGKTYLAARGDGSVSENVQMTEVPFTISESGGSSFAQIILALNDCIAGLIGYDATGALRIEPSQDDVDDSAKPVLWDFSTNENMLFSISETWANADVKNDVIVAGEGATGHAVYGRATNRDPKSDTNINIIGRKLYREDKAEYWNADQCVALAKYYLKRKSVLQKTVTLETDQIFHLHENRLISVRREDKAGHPVERHLIQGFTLPLGETGAMSINAVSVNDYPQISVTASTDFTGGKS